MGTVQEASRMFEQAASRLTGSIQSVAYEYLQDLKKSAEENSPVGDGTHGLAGLYKSSWQVNKDAGSTGLISSYSLFNPSPQAAVLEEGSVPGERPWPSVGPRTMFFRGGNIFSTQAYEGVVAPLLSVSNIDKFATTIADAVLETFK